MFHLLFCNKKPKLSYTGAFLIISRFRLHLTPPVFLLCANKRYSASIAFLCKFPRNMYSLSIKHQFSTFINQNLPSVWFGLLHMAYLIAWGSRRISSYMSSPTTCIRCKYCRNAQSCKRNTPKNPKIESSEFGFEIVCDIGGLSKSFELNGGVYACEKTTKHRIVTIKA